MKRIEAYLPPHRLSMVIHKLHELPRFPGLTVLDAHGQGHGRGPGGHYAYDADSHTYVDRKLLIVLCEDADAPTIAQLIAATARTGNKGDGIVVTMDVLEMLRIRDAVGTDSTMKPESSDELGAPSSGGDA